MMAAEPANEQAGCGARSAVAAIERERCASGRRLAAAGMRLFGVARISSPAGSVI
jgi:hypothetical protein